MGVRPHWVGLHADHAERESLAGNHLRQHGAGAWTRRPHHSSSWRAYQWIRIVISASIGVAIILVFIINELNR